MSGRHGTNHIDLLVTGVGMVATAAHTAACATARRYDVAYNFGVCGSFDRAMALGSVVHVTADRLSELGAEDGDHFVPFECLVWTGRRSSSTTPFPKYCGTARSAVRHRHHGEHGPRARTDDRGGGEIAFGPKSRAWRVRRLPTPVR